MAPVGVQAELPWWVYVASARGRVAPTASAEGPQVVLLARLSSKGGSSVTRHFHAK